MNLPIYLDYHATSPVDPRVLEEMLPYFRDHFGNASSHQHVYGWVAEKAVDIARERVARLIGAEPTEIIFTSGATESINLALKGVADAYRSKGRHLVSWLTEHKATLDPLRQLERLGWEVSRLPVDPEGRIQTARLQETLRPETVLVSLLAANNEIGTLQPVAEVGEITRQKGVLLHVDAAQAAGKIPLDVQAQKIDLLSLSGHKICGPKGVGALYIRRRQPRVRLTPLMDGGGHERGFRSGTLNVPAIVGLGKACALASAEMQAEAARVGELRDRMWERLRKGVAGVVLHGHPTERLAGNLNLAFTGVASSELFAELPEVAFSAGSACTAANPEPSHVLKALGISDEQAKGAVRFGLGRNTTIEEVERATASIVAAVARIRARRSE